MMYERGIEKKELILLRERNEILESQNSFFRYELRRRGREKCFY
jgi:hypothetical protein